MPDIEDLNNAITPSPTAAPDKMFSESDVARMVKERRERDVEQLRLQHEENKRLKSKLEDLEGKMQKGTASTDEMQQLQAAKSTAGNSQVQGYSPEQVQQHVHQALKQQELESKLKDAHEKDPEFAKLVKEQNTRPDGLNVDEVAATAYLPNAPAVIKHLMKDKKSLDTFRAALGNYGTDRGVSAMMVLNNLSDRVGDMQQRPAASDFKPAEELSDASDGEQHFDEKDYIGSRY